MSIIAKKPESNFIPAPVGTYAAVCVDVEDFGERDNPFKPGTKQHMIRLSWQLAERMPDGRPYLVTRLYHLSWHERSTLRQHVEAWIGKLSPAQLEEFDVETLIGRAFLLSIAHTEKSGTTFANVDSVLRLPKKMPAPVTDGSYVRKINRPPVSAPRTFQGKVAAASQRTNGGNHQNDPAESAPSDEMLDREAYERFQEFSS
jgi:hypothetical protein